MMLTLSSRAAYAVLVSLLLAATAQSQNTSAKLDGRSTRSLSVSLLVDQFSSSKQSTRIHAFYTLLGAGAFSGPGAPEAAWRAAMARAPEEERRARDAVVSLLSREQRLVRDTKVRIQSEIFSNYFGDLIWMVAELREPIAVDVLLDALPTGHNAAVGLARLGEPALNRLLTLSRSNSAPDRERSAQGLAVMASEDGRKWIPALRQVDIRATLLRLGTDANPSTRLFAATGLETYRDGEVRALFAQLAADSTDCTSVQGRRVCPVQRLARIWLEKNR